MTDKPRKPGKPVPEPLQPIVDRPAPARRPTAKRTATKRTARPKAAPATTGRKTSVWRRIVRGTLWTLTAITAAGLIAASFGGDIEPSAVKGICIAVMTMPIWIIAIVLVCILDALWCRKALILCALTLIACASAIWEFMPLNFTSPDPARYATCPKFTFMTYNAANLTDLTGTYPDGTNPTISYILRTNADVVNLQEIIVMSPYERFHITQEQIDSLHRAYPYIIWYGFSQMLLSKYPAEAIHTGAPNKSGNEIATFRLNIEGTPVTLFDVHLQSFKLNNDDKTLYKDLTKLKDDGGLRQTLGEVKSQLLSKIQAAAVQRAKDVRRLCGYIDHYGGPNVIVAGDFNDVPGCYALRRLADYDLHQVYSERGFGPMITFNRDRFYFRIDHILYRGALTPLSIKRGNIRYSDHYPLITTFAITSK